MIYKIAATIPAIDQGVVLISTLLAPLPTTLVVCASTTEPLLLDAPTLVLLDGAPVIEALFPCATLLLTPVLAPPDGVVGVTEAEVVLGAPATSEYVK